MMTTLQNKEECGKGPKKTFAPPTQKLHSIIPRGHNLPREETRGISSPDAEAKPVLPKSRVEKKKKVATGENGPGSGQEKKGKVQNIKPAKKKEKEKSSLTNAEFEEIVQIVLQKSLQECLGGMGSGLNFVETSCAQPIVWIQSDKEPGIASATDNDNADGNRVMVPHTAEILASLEDEVVSEIKTSKPGQPVPAPSEKKFNKLSLSKRKKEAHEKMEKVQGGHEHRQKEQPKRMIQDHSQIRGQQKGKRSGLGQYLVWVQCSTPNCEKWRRLRGNIDPSVLPDTWSCGQNTDLDYNRCDIPEEIWTGRESDVAYASYVPGSIIWAKQYGYPWWPGMVESDPDLGEYFLFASHLDSLPSKYHVTFFGETVSRAWIPVNMLKNFQELSLELAGVQRCRNKDYIQKLGPAITMAQKAEQISIQDRVNLFGFWSRYSGSDNNREEKDLMLPDANSRQTSWENEEEEPSDMEEEEKEEKKDPTLPSPKSARRQTKKPKPRPKKDGFLEKADAKRNHKKKEKLQGVKHQRGWELEASMADGQGRTLKKKRVKRSLGTESTASPAPIMGRDEGQRNSDLDQPGPKKKFHIPQSKVSATCLSEGREINMMPKGLTPPARPVPCPSGGEQGPGPQEPPTEEAGSVLPEDEDSSDLDLEQLMEEIGGESEERGELQHREDAEEFPVAFLE